jgi:metal-responsive CopG/Arc/MetJ family transcriptional regulator
MLDPMLEEPFKPILVNIPISLLNELDEVAITLSQTRSHLIRRAISRDLQFVTKHELSRARTSEADIQTCLSKLVDA